MTYQDLQNLFFQDKPTCVLDIKYGITSITYNFIFLPSDKTIKINRKANHKDSVLAYISHWVIMQDDTTELKSFVEMYKDDMFNTLQEDKYSIL